MILKKKQTKKNKQKTTKVFYKPKMVVFMLASLMSA